MSLAAEQYPPTYKSPSSDKGGQTFAPGPLFDLSEANRTLANASPQDILTKALAAANKPIISTSFSAYSAVLLHMVQTIRPGTPVIWCDTGFNTAATYRFVDQLVKRLDINLKVYHPDVSATHLRVRYDGIPEAGTPEHDLFSKTVKLEPFARAFRELQPDLWINGIRSEETEFRKSQDIFTWDEARSTTKVAPCFHSKSIDLVNYLIEHDLPSEVEYHDPTKPEDHLECGLHY
ncbi:MAG: phosphoadenosine phosphosulfate reductase family protein [Porticoccaceae bacterium]|nr:phosphoadenosine phosphosulfate reductase family protein [Porticoccaceae bacterium]